MDYWEALGQFVLAMLVLVEIEKFPQAMELIIFPACSTRFTCTVTGLVEESKSGLEHHKWTSGRSFSSSGRM